MKKLTHTLRFAIFLILFSTCACPSILLGQKSIFDSSRSKSIQLAKPTEVICDRPQSTVCNLIENNIFSTTCFGQNPFWTNCVSKWNSLHGSPQLNVFSPQLSAGVNHVSMWASSEQWPGGQQFFGGEGIVTGIPKLTPGKKYAFSMFKRYFSEPQAPTIDLDNFYIVLLRCADYLPLRTSEHIIPVIPNGSQVIYCERDLTNNTFQRVLQTFTALDEYDIVWIFPKELTYVAGTTKQSWLEIAKFEMISIDNFSAGPPPNPTFPNCNVTLGPSTPNCGVEGAIFTWYGPSGQIIPVPSNNQQIQVNAGSSLNTGNWILKMVVPNVVTTNNNCSNPGIVQASVNVPLCSACTPPIIAPAGPIDYYYLWEAGSGKYTFTTTSNGILQWYVDGQAINGATGNSFTYTFSAAVHSVKVNSNGCFSTPTIINFYPYGDCPQSPFPLPPNSPKNNHCWPAGIITPLYYCQNGISNLQAFDLGPNATYTWNISNDLPGNVIYLNLLSQNQNNASVAVSSTGGLTYAPNKIYAKSVLNGYVKVFDYYVLIPPNIRNAYQTCNNGVGVCYVGISGFDNETYTFPGVITSVSNPAYQSSVGTNTLNCSGVLPNYFQVKFSNPTFVNNFTVSHTNNNYAGDCFNQTVYMYMAPSPCFAPLQNPDEFTQKQLTTIFPNPANNQVTITSNESIKYIEISDLMNPILKRIKVNNPKSTIVDVSDLNPGIYNFKITTSKGTENQKLIIKR